MLIRELIYQEMIEDIKKACQVMSEGGVILYPTDTIWGIGCDATNEEAVRRVYEIKQRSDSKAMLVLVDSPVKVDFYVQDVPEVAWDLIELADKPLTIIYSGARNLAPNLLAEKYGLIQSDIKEVRELLRNKVMHHSMLLLSCFTDRQDIEKEIKTLEKGVEALYRLLPTLELREGSSVDGRISGGLTQAINKSNYPDGDIMKKPYDNIICLHKFKDGRFIL